MVVTFSNIDKTESYMFGVKFSILWNQVKFEMPVRNSCGDVK